MSQTRKYRTGLYVEDPSSTPTHAIAHYVGSCVVECVTSKPTFIVAISDFLDPDGLQLEFLPGNYTLSLGEAASFGSAEC